MGKTKKVLSTGRFGPRYGANVRKKVLKVELRKKKKYLCPRCRKKKLRWRAIGIWECTSCGLKIAGGAWEPVSDIGKRASMVIKRIESRST